MRVPSIVCLAVLALPGAAFAQAPAAPVTTKEGEWDVITLATGALAKVYVPKSLKKGEQPGLVITLHGHGGEPNQMLGYGRDLAEHRGDVWCAYRASTKIGGDSYQYDTAKDVVGVPDMTRHVVAAYKVDPKRVIVHGFSAGGAMSCMVCPKNKDLFAGFVTCAAPDTPGGRGGSDIKGLRAVCFLGETDANYSLAPQGRSAVERFKPSVAFRAITGLGHQLPDPIYLNDAFNFILDATEVGDDKTLPLKPDHALAPPKGRQPPPPLVHAVVVAWKAKNAPEGVTRTKAEAKAIADGLLAKLKKKETTLEQALEQSDDAESKAANGVIDPDRLASFGKKLVDKAKVLKLDAWELVEVDGRYCVVTKRKAAE